MAEDLTSISNLKLSVDDREVVAQAAGELIAVQVYREFQKATELAKASGSGCNIIGNCSSSSKDALMGRR